VVTLNELDIPVGHPVYLKLRSRDVVHSLSLPSFRTKIDAIPGMTTRLWFQATEPGRFEIACAQFCGVNHYKMRGLLVVRPEPDHRRWLARAETDSRLRADANAIGAWDWETGQ
jgi:cytochrome c oxidase subunit 2